MCEVFKEHTAQWLSWLERRPVTAEVTGSSPVWVVFCTLDRYRKFMPIWLKWQSS